MCKQTTLAVCCLLIMSYIPTAAESFVHFIPFMIDLMSLVPSLGLCQTTATLYTEEQAASPFFFVGEPRPREEPKAESGDGVLGEGQQPLPPARGSGAEP